MQPNTQDKLIFRAAWLYYMQDKLQSEVADILGVSRASIALYLKRARESGIVRITMDPGLFQEHRISSDLEARFGVESAFVLSCTGSDTEVLRELAILGGEVLLKDLVDGDELGVAWGVTLYELAACLPRKNYKDLEVVQVCGNLGAPYGYAPEQCTLEIANKLNARSRNLYAPLSLSTAALAKALRQEPIIAEQLKIMATCTKVVFSIGVCDRDSHLVKCGAISPDEMDKKRKKGARAVVAGRLIDKSGRPVQSRNTDRTIGISLDAIRKIPYRLVIAGCLEKAEAIHAALEGGYATHLVIDQATAEAVLAMD